VLEGLRRIGWRVEAAGTRRPLPDTVLRRYPWIPADVRALVESLEEAVDPTQTTWILTSADFASISPKAFEWNAWELMSLEAARTDKAWADEILAFWDAHLPLVLSVKGGYSCFAVERGSLEIVQGNEPEFEESRPVADSLEEFIALLATGDPALGTWV
jgi:hypothetical protein